MPYVAGGLALQRERLAGDRGEHFGPRELEAGRTRRHYRLYSRGSRANELTGSRASCLTRLTGLQSVVAYE